MLSRSGKWSQETLRRQILRDRGARAAVRRQLAERPRVLAHHRVRVGVRRQPEEHRVVAAQAPPRAVAVAEAEHIRPRKARRS